MFWWVLLGYPDAFELGKDEFFPRPGQVVKYYREQKMNEKGKAWTQQDLAKVLGISIQSVGETENRDVGMSYERRQFLSKLFDIPPILLGIVSTEEINLLVAQHHQTNKVAVISTPSYTGRKLVIDPQEYNDQLATYWQTHYSATAANTIAEMFIKLDTLYRELPHARDGQDKIQTLLCKYHHLISRIFFDQHMHEEAIVHLDKALFFAEALMNEELIALTFKRRGWIRPYIDDIDNAVDDFEKARKYKKLPYNLACSILMEAGNVAAHEKSADTEKYDKAIALIDKGGNMIRSAPDEPDSHFLKVQLNDYYYHKAATLIKAGRNRDALEEIKLINNHYTPRGQITTGILQAQAYFNRGKYPHAASVAQHALEIAQEIKSEVNIARIRKIFYQLRESPYKDSSDVARLDYLLST